MTRSLALFLSVVPLLMVCAAQAQSDCPPRTVINNGVCIGKNSNDCTTKPQSVVCYDPDPQYTDEAAAANVKGTLLLTATVGTDGCAHNIKVVGSLGFGLDDAAISAMERWRFRKSAKPRPISVELYFDPKTSSRTPLTAEKCATFVASTEVGWTQASRPLRNRIPKSDHTKYDSVRDGTQWKNPYLIVRPDGIEISGVTPIGRGIALSSLSELLEKLPDSAWPYGLVVAVQDVGLGSGKTDSARIEANRIKLLNLLNELGITVEQWPSA